MERLTQLLKDHQVGEWCKRGAWVIAAIMVIDSILDVSYLKSQGLGLVEMLRFLLANLSTTLFYFFLLSAAGAIINRLVALTKRDETELEESEMMADEEETEAVRVSQSTKG